MKTRLLLLPMLGLLVAGAPTRGVAQSRSAAILAEARDSIEQGAFEPALSLIDVALKNPRAVPTALRVRAYVLQGLTLTLIGGRDDEAAEAFVEALSLDRSLTVDSLQALSNQLVRVFGEAKDQLAQEDSASLGELEIRGLPPSAVRLAVDDTVWNEMIRDVAPGWRHIVVTGSAYLPYRDSVLVDTAASVVWVVNLVPAPLRLSVILPDRASVPATQALYHVGLVSGRRCLVTVTLAGADGSPVRSDSETVDGSAGLGLPLRRAEGAILPAGRYYLRVNAVDSIGEVAEPVVRYLLLSRAVVDTAPTPQPPLPSSFLPETVSTHPGPAALALGSVLLAAVTAAAPAFLGNRDLGPAALASRPVIAVAVGGAIGISGIVGFVTGKMNRPSSANIRLNQQRRADYLGAVGDVAQENARRRSEAPIIVTVERGAP